MGRAFLGVAKNTQALLKNLSLRQGEPPGVCCMSLTRGARPARLQAGRPGGGAYYPSITGQRANAR
jgi:hypothetical protein